MKFIAIYHFSKLFTIRLTDNNFPTKKETNVFINIPLYTLCITIIQYIIHIRTHKNTFNENNFDYKHKSARNIFYENSMCVIHNLNWKMLFYVCWIIITRMSKKSTNCCENEIIYFEEYITIIYKRNGTNFQVYKANLQGDRLLYA